MPRNTEAPAAHTARVHQTRLFQEVEVFSHSTLHDDPQFQAFTHASSSFPHPRNLSATFRSFTLDHVWRTLVESLVSPYCLV